MHASCLSCYGKETENGVLCDASTSEFIYAIECAGLRAHGMGVFLVHKSCAHRCVLVASESRPFIIIACGVCDGVMSNITRIYAPTCVCLE